jgi:carbamoyl-phosphate synthase large subunit
MEHVERAGVHSGDSIAIYPSLSTSSEEESQIIEYTKRIACGLGIKGLLNIQFVIPEKGVFMPQTGLQNTPRSNSTVYVIEANPRSSRTVPFISKATGVPLVEIAVNVMLGKSIKEQGYSDGLIQSKGLIAIKAPVFSMSKLVGVDTQLGPEMKSTGEVMGVDSAFRPALIKALIAAGLNLPAKGTTLLSLANRDKDQSASMIKRLDSSGYDFYATKGTASFIKSLGVASKINVAHKINEGTPDVTDIVRTKKIDFVINTPSGEGAAEKDGFEIRRAAAETNTPCFTSLDTAIVAAETLSLRSDFYNIKPITKYLDSKNQINKHVK